MAAGEPGRLVSVRGLAKGFRVNGHLAPALELVSFEVAEAEVLGILGPSGCGKTTLLNLMAGFTAPDQGQVLMAGRPVTGPGPQRGVVFQEDALFPWLTVRENLAFGLKRTDKDRRRRRLRVAEFLEMVGLAEFADYLPREISGGMKQRVALARVLVMGPKVLLMDEPFAALDAQTRGEMHRLLMDLQARLNQTIVFVTHDLDEAVRLADRVLVMSPAPGRVAAEVAVGLPRPRVSDAPAFFAIRRALGDRLAQAMAPPQA